MKPVIAIILGFLIGVFTLGLGAPFFVALLVTAIGTGILML